MTRKTKLLATAALAVALAVTPAGALAAKPKLDKGFGLHHGYWIRTDGVWASPWELNSAANGTALLTSGDGRFARIGADGKADGGWGSGGAVDLADDVRGTSGYASTIAAVRWQGRYLLTAVLGTGAQVARVVDARGRTLPVTAAVQATMPPVDPTPLNSYALARLQPAPDGQLWDLRVHNTYTLPTYETVEHPSLSRLSASGTPLVRDRINLVSLPGSVDAALGSSRGLLVTTWDRRSSRLTLYRLERDGSLDNGFRPASLWRGDAVAQMLPWHGGAVAVSDDGRVAWVSDTGRVARQRKLAAGSRVAFDTAGRLVAVASHPSHHLVLVRRLLRDGRDDRGFGTVRLRAAGRLVDAIGLVPAPGGRVLVVGSSLTENPAAVRDDFLVPHATVVWRLRTR